MKSYFRPARSAWVAGIALMLTTSAAQSQTTESREFQGWTATGNEVVAQVSKSREGIGDDGDPEQWSYTVLEIANSESGEVLGRYQVGTASGQPQSEWTEAKDEAAGKKRVGALGLIPGVPTPISPDGSMTLVSLVSQSRTGGIMTAECPGCMTCTTSLRVVLVHSRLHKVYSVSEHDATGSAFPPDDTTGDCPDVTAEFFWHPQSNRFAITTTDTVRSAGSTVESVGVQLVSKGLTSWQSNAIPERKDSTRDALYERVEILKKELRAATEPTDKARVLVKLGDVSRSLGKMEAAAGLYSTALEFDRKSTHAMLGQALVDLQEGRERQALKTAKKVARLDRRRRELGTELGLFYLIAGDTKKAEKHLQGAVDSGGGADFATRLDLGLRILNADASAGLAYLDNLLSAVPDGLPKATADRVNAIYVRLADEGIHVRDIPFAAAYTSRLPKGSDEAQRLALMISAIRSDDKSKAKLAFERTTKLVDEDPTKCDLYFVRGMALRRLNQLHQTFANFAAAVSCDPQLAEAHYYLAEMYSIAGQLDKAREHYKTFMELAPPRRGDPARTLRRARIESLLPRLKHKGIILLSHDCNRRSGQIRCTGVLTNTQPTPSGPVAIGMVAHSRGRRPKVVAQGEAKVSGIVSGATIDFKIAMEAIEDVDMELTAGRNDTERELNRTVVVVY